jgi:hypothetical protein
VIGQTVRLVLEGVTNEPVLITRVDPVVVNRRPPLRGWWVPPEPGGGARVRYFETGLECARPQLVALGGHHGPGLRPVRALNLEVSRLDKEQLEITAYSAKHYLEWGIDVAYVADGQVHTLMVRDPRLRVTAISRGLHGYFPALHTTALRRAPAADPTSQDVAYWERVSKELCPR